jgi:hypothetical protein
VYVDSEFGARNVVIRLGNSAVGAIRSTAGCIVKLIVLCTMAVETEALFLKSINGPAHGVETKVYVRRIMVYHSLS